MADDSTPDSSLWDGTVPRYPDPETIGPSLTAWYGLHDDFPGDPAEILAWAADAIATRLGAFGPRVANPLTLGQVSVAIKEAKFLLEMVAEIFGRSELPADDEARFAFNAELKRRRGRPVKPGKLRPQSLGWWGVALEVEELIAAGELQKVAVGKVAKRLGLKDAVVAGWCRKRRNSLDRSSWLTGDTDN
ncbi:MAG: hypothetical protein WBL74_06335 [Novosphingobium sp.]|uniref:hypothetical protein n=1 Tax=Novosphingobium sp. TaxID=1874826 RepID=UPI003C7D856E